MNTQDAYNHWASQYDTNLNKTRDLEAIALRETLNNIPFTSCLEIGCGTGKNTVWYAEKANEVTAADLSEEMLAKAKEKVQASNVSFMQADILAHWPFEKEQYDLAGYSLILEHIEELEPVFKHTASSLKSGGYMYVGELHPFKQYSGSKARFETETGVQVVPCFNHHVSDFINAAAKSGLHPEQLKEYFDDDDRGAIPRLLVLLFRKL